MGKSVKNMVIDAEVVSRVEREVSPARTSPASVSAPQPQTVAAPARGRARGKAKRGPSPQAQELAFGGLRIRMPEPRLRCPVCQAPATPDRQISVGPIHTYLCPDCGDVASGAMQVVNFFKMLK